MHKPNAYITAAMQEVLDRLLAEGKISPTDVADLIDGVVDCVDTACYWRAGQPIVQVQLLETAP